MMPIYEYTCKKCSEKFEVLTFGNGKEVSCPKCESKYIKKSFSTFAAISPSSNTSDPSCVTPACGYNTGACGSGMCGIK